MFSKIDEVMIKAQKYLFSTIVVGMLCVLAINVFLRYVFNNSIIWTDEVTTMTQGVLAFLGIGYCTRLGKHTEVSIFYNILNRPLQWICRITSNLVMLFCLWLLKLEALQYVSTQHISLGTVEWLKVSYLYIFIPIGLFIAEIYIFFDLIRIFPEIKKYCKNTTEHIQEL